MTSESKTDKNRGVNLKQLLDAVKKINPEAEKIAERMLSNTKAEIIDALSPENVIEMVTPVLEQQSAQIAEQVEKKLEEQSTWIGENFSQLFDMVSKGHEVTANGFTSLNKTHENGLKSLEKSVSDLSKGQSKQDDRLEQALKLLATQDGKIADLGKGQAEIGQGVAKSQQHVSLLFDEVGRANDSLGDISSQVGSIHAAAKSGFNQKEFKQLFRAMEAAIKPGREKMDTITGLIRRNHSTQMSHITSMKTEFESSIEDTAAMAKDFGRVVLALKKVADELMGTMGPAIDETQGLYEKLVDLVGEAESISSSLGDSSQVAKSVVSEYIASIEQNNKIVDRNIQELIASASKDKREFVSTLQKMLSEQHGNLDEHMKSLTDLASSELARAGRGLNQHNDKLRLAVEALSDNMVSSVSENERMMANLRRELASYLESVKDHTLGESQVEMLCRLASGVDSLRTNQMNVTGGFNELKNTLLTVIDALTEVDVSDTPEDQG